MKSVIVFILLLTFSSLSFADSSSTIELSLDDAIKLALRKNIDIINYYDSYELSKLYLELERYEFEFRAAPNFSFGAEDGSQNVQTYGITVDRKATLGTEMDVSVETKIYNNSTQTYSSSATISITQPLMKGAGRIYNTNSLLSAEEDQIQQERSLILAKQSLIINCISSYCRIVEYQMMREAYNKSYERTVELLNQAKVKLEFGTVSKMDVYRADIASLESKNNLLTYDEAILNALDSFKLLLGVPIDQDINLTDKDFTYEKELIPMSDAIESAIINRFELKTYKEDLLAYERNLHIAKSNLSPPLDLNAQASFSGDGDTFNESTGLDEESWAVYLSSSFDLERKSESVSYMNALINLNRARREQREFEDEITIEVKVNHRNVVQNYERISLQKKSVLESEKQLEFTLLRYTGGKIDNLGVIEAEENLIQAKIQYYSAITNYIVSLYKLKKSMGTLDVTIYE